MLNTKFIRIYMVRVDEIKRATLLSVLWRTGPGPGNQCSMKKQELGAGVGFQGRLSPASHGVGGRSGARYVEGRGAGKPTAQPICYLFFF